MCDGAVCRGLPVQRYTRAQTIIAYWGIGLYWGKAQSNNKKGHLIGHIKDIGYDPSKPTTRLYATKEAQPWHNDSSDMVGMSLHRLLPFASQDEMLIDAPDWCHLPLDWLGSQRAPFSTLIENI